MRRRKDRKRNPFVADYRDAMGRRHRLSAPTKEAAKLLEADKLRETHEAQPTAENRDITVSTYAQVWLQRVDGQLARATARVYRYAIENHIAPTFGAMKLRDLTRVHVKWLVGEKLQAGLSKGTVSLIRAALCSMLAEALDDGVVKLNVGLATGRRRKAETSTAIERAESIRPFSEAEVPALLAAARDHDDRTLLMLLLRTGVRPGEALGLRWPDLNFTERDILVERAFYDGYLGPPKTRRSRRVDMSQDLAAALGVLYVQREREKLEGRRAEIPDWVFCRRDGRPLTQNDIRACFDRTLRHADLSGHTPYDCRHTFASHLLAKGVPITYVSAQLGHKKPTTTLLFYAHYMPSRDRGYVDSLDERRQPSPMGTTFGTTQRNAPTLQRELGDPHLNVH